MDQLNIAEQLSALTIKMHQALTRNTPGEVNKSDILDAVTDIVLFIRDQDTDDQKELMFAIARDEFFGNIFGIAEEFTEVGVHEDFFADFVAYNGNLAQIFHQLIQEGEVPAAIRLLKIARTDLQSLTSNSNLDQIIRPVNSLDFSLGIPPASQQQVIEDLVGTLEDIAADQDATTAFHRNSRYGQTCDGYSALKHSTKDIAIRDRIDGALTTIAERLPPTNEMSIQ